MSEIKTWETVLREVCETDPADFHNPKNIYITPCELGDILRAAFEEKQSEIEELRAALKERDAKLAALEPFDDWPDYHSEAMGCGLEDRNITDRYEAMQYGWDKALDRVAERLEGYAAAAAASEWNDFVEIACARIKSADDAAADGDYMLDSSDCIKVLRGTWGGNYLNDHPVLPAAGAAPVPTGWVSVNDRLPERVDVEFYSPDLRNPCQHLIGRLMDGKWMCAGYEMLNVSHWKPLAVAPKEQS